MVGGPVALGLSRCRATGEEILMKIEGTIPVTCEACGRAGEHPLVQLVHAQNMPEARERLLRGDLNVARCECGKVTALACELVYQDPLAGLLCHVCPGGEAALARAEAAFHAAFGSELGTYRVQRLVPSQNALLEKIKIAEAGLADWAVEMLKVLLLASIAVDDDDRVMLFSGVDEQAQTVRWLLFDRHGEVPTPMSSPLAGHQRLLATAGAPPPPPVRRIDRAWAVEAVRAMIAAAN